MTLILGEPLKFGDIIQLGPRHEFGGCVAIVEEIGPYGRVRANILAPLKPAEGQTRRRIALVPLEVEKGHYKRVGPAQYLVAWARSS